MLPAVGQFTIFNPTTAQWLLVFIVNCFAAQDMGSIKGTYTVYKHGNIYYICIIKLIIYASTTILFTHKATCFDPSFGHLQVYITD